MPVAVVAVPVRNEGERLKSLLLTLARQRGAPPFALCLFLDACTDNSLEVARELVPTLPFRIEIACADDARPPNAGRARSCAAALASRIAPGAALLTTDADSEPDPDWVAVNLRALGRADLVAGCILLDDPTAAPLQARLARYYDQLYAARRAIDPVAWEDRATHHWTSGASLAFRAAAYASLGGFEPLPRGEDAAIVDRAWRMGLRVRRDPAVIVTTSSRRRGRAPGGFASDLALFDGAAELPHVGHPEDELWRYRRHAEARLAFDAGMPCSMAMSLRLPTAELRQVANECANADAFAARVVGAPPGGLRKVSLALGEALLTAADGGELEDVA